jgi:glycerophosphoryl diester phosphodiesterase
MKIIGHRGARGVELENSLASIKKALELPIDAIEFDIHRTNDGALVVLHDATTGRVAEQDVRIAETSLADLRQVKLKNGQAIPLLAEVLALAGSHPIYIDIKDEGCARPLVELLHGYPDAQVSFVSRLPAELKTIRSLLPNAVTGLYFLKAEYFIARPFKMVRAAQDAQATTIGIDKLFLLNPLLYYLARRRGLQTYAYSIGSVSLARLLLFFFPKLDLCTSRPDLLTKLVH